MSCDGGERRGGGGGGGSVLTGGEHSMFCVLSIQSVLSINGISSTRLQHWAALSKIAAVVVHSFLRRPSWIVSRQLQRGGGHQHQPPSRPQRGRRPELDAVARARWTTRRLRAHLMQVIYCPASPTRSVPHTQTNTPRLLREHCVYIRLCYCCLCLCSTN